MRAILALFLILAASPGMAASSSAWDKCVRKLCTSPTQSACWIKPGSAICDRDQIQCRELPDQTAAKVLRKEARRWEVQTSAGKGWVSDRMMQIDGSACPELGN